MIWLSEIVLIYDIRLCSYFLLLKRFPLTVGLHKGSHNSPSIENRCRMFSPGFDFEVGRNQFFTGRASVIPTAVVVNMCSNNNGTLLAWSSVTIVQRCSAGLVYAPRALLLIHICAEACMTGKRHHLLAFRAHLVYFSSNQLGLEQNVPNILCSCIPHVSRQLFPPVMTETRQVVCTALISQLSS